MIIETSRLEIHEFTADIAPYFYELNNDPQVLKYTGDNAFSDLQECEKFIDKYNSYKLYGYGRWSVIRKSDRKWIGWCGLKNQGERIADIGFRFFQDEWNKGYATESARACIEIGFSKYGLNKIIARASSQNNASIKVIKKLSLQYVELKDIEGIPSSMCFEISKEQYKNIKDAQ